MAVEEAANIEETGTTRGRRGSELAAWWTRHHRGAAGPQHASTGQARSCSGGRWWQGQGREAGAPGRATWNPLETLAAVGTLNVQSKSDGGEKTGDVAQ